jgi:hypothetical protein
MRVKSPGTPPTTSSFSRYYFFFQPLLTFVQILKVLDPGPEWYSDHHRAGRVLLRMFAHRGESHQTAKRMRYDLHWLIRKLSFHEENEERGDGLDQDNI